MKALVLAALLAQAADAPVVVRLPEGAPAPWDAVCMTEGKAVAVARDRVACYAQLRQYEEVDGAKLVLTVGAGAFMVALIGGIAIGYFTAKR